MKVGLTGIGTMGKPMAQHILEAGFPLFIFARHPEKAQSLKEKGVQLVDSPAELGRLCDCVLLSLPFDPEVKEVVLGERGVARTAPPGFIILDTTTGTPKAAMELAQQLAPRKIHYLDAPISVGAKGAVEGKLTFMVGGDKEAFEKVKPLMKILGANIFHLGPVGTGRAIKSLNQMVAALNTLTICEAVVMGKKLGISPETFYEVLSKCAANSYHLQTKLPQFIIPGKFIGGHRIEMMVKDLEIALQVARDLKTPTIMTSLATQLYRAAASAGYSEKDISAMANFFGSFVGVNFSSSSSS